CMMGHTDVVPVNPAGWTRDPFGGELIDGEVWGRGALDMLCLTSSMAVAFKELAMSGFRPRGDLIYFGVADEEAGGAHGAEWIVDHHWDAVKCDYMVTELGGFWAGDGRSVMISTAEKGVAWRRLTIAGTPSHGSMPYATDNAVVTAAEIIRRISSHAGTARTGALWDALLRTSSLPTALVEKLADPAQLDDALAHLPPMVARRFHACSHTTMSCNVVHGGQKTNMVPDSVMLDVDVRTMPGVDGDDVDGLLLEILGELAPRVTISRLQNGMATESTTESSLWGALSGRISAMYPQAELVPGLMVGGTDGRFFREKGTVVYGAGLFSPSLDRAAVANRFHGNDERIDVESLRLCTDLWLGLARDVVG
ncbi:MAG: M20/M25/M40 family metallo-hydrolase, partial [Ilumatobacteraceae bacterium]|nr:M20/M25/M40 family metallo-hydrolase [Ilumatobacteraceae bacterium]